MSRFALQCLSDTEGALFMEIRLNGSITEDKIDESVILKEKVLMLEFIEYCKDIYDNKLKEVCCAVFYITNAFRHKPDEVTLNGLKTIFNETDICHLYRYDIGLVLANSKYAYDILAKLETLEKDISKENPICYTIVYRNGYGPNSAAKDVLRLMLRAYKIMNYFIHSEEGVNFISDEYMKLTNPRDLDDLGGEDSIWRNTSKEIENFAKDIFWVNCKPKFGSTLKMIK